VFKDVATAWTGVDTSTSLCPEVVAEIDANPEHKKLNLYTRASSLYAMLEQARRDTHNKYDTLHDVRDTHDTCWE